MSVYYVTDQTLSDEELWALTSKYFGDLGPGVVQGMFNIAKRESGGQAGIVNFNPDTRDDSHGLWQINIRPDANPKYIGLRLDDPEVNARVAREMYDASGPSPWSTYNPTTDAAMFNNGGGGPDQAGLGGQATTPRPLVEMSSVKSPTYGTAQAAAPAVRQPLPEPDWSQLGTLIKAGGGTDPFGGAMGSSPLIPQRASAGMTPLSQPSTGGIFGSPPPLESIIKPIPNAPVSDGTLPLVPIPNAPIMGPDEWKKLLVPLGYGG